jgi:hypothetical protein
MAQAERLALQSDLAWVGHYNGAMTGDVSERMVAAIKEYQKAKGGKPTGVLNPQERSVLAETARRRQENVGWKLVTDPVTGARLGIPTKLVPQQTSDADGSKWSSPTGTIQVLLSRRKEAGPTTAKLADHEKKEPAGRRIDYTVVKPDFFVLSGMQGLKKFYLRGTFKGDEVRVMTILYDQATENTVEPVVIAMSSAFSAFPTGVQGPPPRKTVEYSTGMVVTEDGAIIADREATDGCLAITIQGLGHADRLAEDKDRGLALLHIYGAQELKPLNLSDGTARSSVDIVGVADPQSQGGGAAVTSVKSQVAPGGAGGDLALSPAPAIGFSGAAARQGRQVCGARGAEARGGRNDGGRQHAARHTSGAGERRCRARFSESQRCDGIRNLDGREGSRRARDLREEVTIVRAAVGWAKARKRRAHRLSTMRLAMVGTRSLSSGRAFARTRWLCPPHEPHPGRANPETLARRRGRIFLDPRSDMAMRRGALCRGTHLAARPAVWFWQSRCRQNLCGNARAI